MKYIYIRLPKLFFLLPILLIISNSVLYAQLVVTPAQPASVLASTLAGPGVSTFGATLTCPGVANGTFTSAGTPLAMSGGVVLTNGHASACAGPEGALISFNDGAPGDPALAPFLPAGTTIVDACILEFNVVAMGDTLSFNYQFGSEEYRNAVCSIYTDVFAFFISGPGITGTPNIALVPGTNIPVEINSVNNGTPGYVGGANIANCNALGAGSPFTSFYIDNTGGTLMSYRGYTQKFRAFHNVIPCDTYHLKLSIVDAGNALYDSGVFLEAGSLKTNSYAFNHADSIGATINGVPHTIVKGCNPTSVTINAAHANATNTTLNLSFGGTAVNGVDVTTVPTTVNLPADSTSVTINIAGIPTPPGGTKVFTIYLHSICGIADSIAITVMDTPSAHILTPDTTICSGQSTMIRVAGTPGLQYSWSPAAGLSSTTVMEPIATPTVTTTYVMTATLPGSGCPPIVRNVTLSVINTTISMLTPDTTICLGSSVNLRVNGSPTLTYNWIPTIGLSSASVQDPTASPTSTITYTVNATGPGGICPSSANVTITVNSINAAILTPDTTECGATFPIRVTGTPGLIYSWTPATGLSSTTAMDPIATPSVTTTYVMTASLPGSGCPPITKTITVTMANTIINILTPDTTICRGDTVDIRVVANGYLIYNWTPGTGLNAYNIQDPIATPTITTTYSVYAAQPSGMCPDSAKLTIHVIDPLAVIITPDTTICHGDSLQLIVETSSSLIYHWAPPTGLSNPNTAEPFAQPLVSTIYTLTTTTINGGCSANASVVIAVAGGGAVEFTSTDSVLCEGTYIGFIAVGSVGNVGVLWNFGDGDSVQNQNPVVHAFNVTGTFTVSVAALYPGCPDTVKSKVVNIYPQPAIYLGNDTSICPGGEPILLYDHYNPGSGDATWEWSNGATTPSIYVTTPGTYYCIVSINGCKSTDSVIVLPDCYIDIPNVFTPNGDGTNDFFFPRQFLSRGLTEFKLKIFNRWGEVVFETNSLDGRGWDGTYNGVKQPEGVFVYLIDAYFKDGQIVHRKGNVTLLR